MQIPTAELRSVLLPALFLFVPTACHSTDGDGRSEADTVVTAEHSRPNVLLILADDLGYADCGFTGSRDVLTPNLDAWLGRGSYSPMPTSRPVSVHLRARVS